MFTTINSLFPLSLLYSVQVLALAVLMCLLGNLGLRGSLVFNLSPKNTMYLIMQIAHQAFSSRPRCSLGKTKPGFFSFSLSP